MANLTVGTKVILSKTSKFYSSSAGIQREHRMSGNPINTVGVVEHIKPSRIDPSQHIMVRWENGKLNTYEDVDLDVINVTRKEVPASESVKVPKNTRNNNKTLKKSDIYELGIMMYSLGCKHEKLDLTKLSDHNSLKKYMNEILTKLQDGSGTIQLIKDLTSNS